MTQRWTPEFACAEPRAVSHVAMGAIEAAIAASPEVRSPRLFAQGFGLARSLKPQAQGPQWRFTRSPAGRPSLVH